MELIEPTKSCPIYSLLWLPILPPRFLQDWPFIISCIMYWALYSKFFISKRLRLIKEKKGQEISLPQKHKHNIKK